MFDIIEGGICCRNCARGALMRLSAAQLQWMRDTLKNGLDVPAIKPKTKPCLKCCGAMWNPGWKPRLSPVSFCRRNDEEMNDIDRSKGEDWSVYISR